MLNTENYFIELVDVGVWLWRSFPLTLFLIRVSVTLLPVPHKVSISNSYTNTTHSAALSGSKF